MLTSRQMYGHGEAHSRFSQFSECASKGVLGSVSVAAHFFFTWAIDGLELSTERTRRIYSEGKNRKCAMDRKLVNAVENINILAYSNKDFYLMAISSYLINL